MDQIRDWKKFSRKEILIEHGKIQPFLEGLCYLSSKPRQKILEKYADFEENVLCVRTQTILKFLND